MIGPRVSHPGPSTPWLLYWVARIWMFVLRWDVEGAPPNARKAVVIAAPHTSNWDLPHMLAASWVFRFRVNWLGKHTLFKPPFGWFMRWLGGLPVDRRAPRGTVQQAADLFTHADQLMIAVPPAGTRAKRPHWKSGFYWIAHTAQVPIVCGYLDFRRRRASLGLTFMPTGDIRADMAKIRAFYEGVQGLYPDQQTPVLVKEELEEAPETPSDEQAAPQEPQPT